MMRFRRGEALRFLKLVLEGADQGWITGRIDREVHYALPKDVGALLEAAEAGVAAGHDVYINPLPRRTRQRRKGGALPGLVVWADLDHEPTPEQDELMERIGAIRVPSGSPGHHHIYVRLAGPTPPDEIEGLNRALRDRLGGDAKWSDESLLRLPGTWNFKPEAGPEGAPVRIYRNGHRPIDPERLRELLAGGVHPGDESTGEALPEPVAFPEPVADGVLRALDRALQVAAEDRSDAHAGLVWACLDAGWSPGQALRFSLERFPPASDKYGERPGGVATDVARLAAEWRRKRPALNLPDEFWNERPVLGHIRRAAWSRMLSPDAVLHVVLSRVAAAVPHQLRLPAVVSAASPLCYFTFLVGDSGGGKSTANDLGEELLPLEPVQVRDVQLGSGEGLVESYFDWVEVEQPSGKTKRVRKRVFYNAHIYVDQGVTLDAFRARAGNTTLPTIRSMWSGRSVGQNNARAETTRVLAKGTYSLGLVVAIQEELAKALLDDAPGGTPQRFTWAWTTDPATPTPEEQPPWPGPLPWGRPGLGQARLWGDGDGDAPTQDRLFDVAGTVTAELRESAHGRATGRVKVKPLDAHRGLVRLRIAALLAILDGRPDVEPDDWRLAGVVLDTSDRVRAHVQARAAAIERAKETEGSARAARRAVATTEATSTWREVECAKRVARRVRGDPERWTRSDLRRDLRAWRDVFDEGLEHAIEQGWVREEAEPGTSDSPKRALRPGPMRPPRMGSK